MIKMETPGSLVSLVPSSEQWRQHSPGFLWAQYRLSLAADLTDQLRSMKNF